MVNPLETGRIQDRLALTAPRRSPTSGTRRRVRQYDREPGSI